MSKHRMLSKVAGIAVACLVSAVVAQTLPPAPVEERSAPSADSTRLLLDAIRDDLVGLRFEEALAAIEALLGQPGLSEAERGEARVLRSQAHVAFGDLDAAEADYREILRTRPGFVPDTSLTPSKAMERFHRARAALVGDLIVDVQPADARLSVDGRAVTVRADARIPLLAGEHVLRLEREGFDPLRQAVQVEANRDGRVELRLVPNARTVILRTEPEGVDVTLDGVRVGRTARPSDGDTWAAAREPAQLEIENLSLGEHAFEFSKDCYRNDSIRDLLTVDLLDWTPKTYPRVALVPVRSTVMLRGGPDGAQVRVDGEQVARLPAESFEVCPGERRIEVRLGERRVWSRTMALAEAAEAVVEVEPRPNVVLLGVVEWPAELGAFAERFNTTLASAALPAGDLAHPEAWKRLRLPTDTDLVLAPREAGQGGSAWWLYSPVLQLVTPLGATPPTIEWRPRWTGVSWGLSIVDSVRSGPALVARVIEDGPASRAGLQPADRLVSLGGSQVADSNQARRILAVASGVAPLDAEWLSPDGTAHRGRLSGKSTARLLAGAPTAAEAMVRAAWAVVDAASHAEHAAMATANLALLLSLHGRYELAARTWRQVELPERAGIGRGTVQYYLGRDLERLGAEQEAIRAHRAAAASDATAFDDEGPRVAPAARDHLADLGIQ